MTETGEQHFKALDRLADYLAARDHSEKELQEKLSRKFPEDVVRWAISEAKDKNWLLPPEELAEKVAASLQRRGKGSFYICRYLQEKGLPEVSIDEDTELENCKSLLARKFPSVAETPFKDYEKALRFMSQRGFALNLTKKAIDDIQRTSPEIY